MNKFIKNIIYFSLRHRYLIFFFTAILVVIGVVSYRNTPIETFPDVTNTQVVIIAQWPGRSAEEVEKFVTIPLETVLNSVQKKANLRTTSAFGLSYTRIIFDDDADDADELLLSAESPCLRESQSAVCHSINNYHWR